MASNSQNLCEILNETIKSFKNLLSFIIRNQRHLELNQIKMIREQERHFDHIRWLIASLDKEDNDMKPNGTQNLDNEEWENIKRDPIFGEDGWVEVPRDV